MITESQTAVKLALHIRKPDSILTIPAGTPAPAFAADDTILVISNRPDFPAS
ncbi:MAG: hypothetical protein WCP35_05660 [Verrucomicrobiota bacterium]